MDVWHCDAAGVYSGVQGNAGSFLRGIQRTDAKGVALFRTIYPGWYPGRTVHVHVQVSLGGNVVHTGQLYFSDAVTDAVYRPEPYSRRPNRDPAERRRPDLPERRQALDAEAPESGSAYVGSITMGVVRG